MELIHRAYKFRIFPKKETETLFIQNCGSTRFIWNQLLATHEHDYKLLKEIKSNPRFKIKPTKYTFRKTYYNHRLMELKQNHSWLYESDSTSLQSVFEFLYTAFQNFFNGLGYPHFKSKRNLKQSFKIKNNNESIRFKDNNIRLNKLGFVKYKDNREIKGRIISATISYKNNKWYCSLVVEEEKPQPFPKTHLIIGLDLGLTDFVTCSDGLVKAKPDTHELEIKLKKLQRKFSNQQVKQGKKHIRRKGLTNNARKTLKKIYKVTDKIRNIQDDFFHKLSLELVQNYDTICLETLTIKNMLKNKRLSHSIHEISWYKFITFLKYKCEWYNKQFIQVSSRFPSSKLCNRCGWKHKNLTLNIREWICPECGTKHDRDVNASINILNEGLNILNRWDDGDSLVLP